MTSTIVISAVSLLLLVGLIMGAALIMGEGKEKKIVVKSGDSSRVTIEKNKVTIYYDDAPPVPFDSDDMPEILLDGEDPVAAFLSGRYNSGNVKELVSILMDGGLRVTDRYGRELELEEAVSVALRNLHEDTDIAFAASDSEPSPEDDIYRESEGLEGEQEDSDNISDTDSEGSSDGEPYSMNDAVAEAEAMEEAMEEAARRYVDETPSMEERSLIQESDTLFPEDDDVDRSPRTMFQVFKQHMRNTGEIRYNS